MENLNWKKIIEQAKRMKIAFQPMPDDQPMPMADPMMADPMMAAAMGGGMIPPQPMAAMPTDPAAMPQGGFSPQPAAAMPPDPTMAGGMPQGEVVDPNEVNAIIEQVLGAIEEIGKTLEEMAKSQEGILAKQEDLEKRLVEVEAVLLDSDTPPPFPANNQMPALPQPLSNLAV